MKHIDGVYWNRIVHRCQLVPDTMLVYTDSMLILTVIGIGFYRSRIFALEYLYSNRYDLHCLHLLST